MSKEEFKKEYPELFKSVPSDILGLFFSEKTPLQISEICLRNGIEDGEKISQTAYWIGRVLLGGLSPEKLAETLEKEVKLDQETTRKIAAEADETFFSPLEKTLAAFYKGKNLPAARPPKVVSGEEAEPETLTSPEKVEVTPSPPETPEEVSLPETPENPVSLEEKPTPQSGEDTYREPIE